MVHPHELTPSRSVLPSPSTSIGLTSFLFQEILAEMAADLGVDVEDLDFGEVAFYQGPAFDIPQEFEGGSVQLSNVRGELFSFFLFLLLFLSSFSSSWK